MIFIFRLACLFVLGVLTSFDALGEAAVHKERCSTRGPSHLQARLVEAQLSALSDVVTASSAPRQVAVAFHVIQNSSGSNTTTTEQLNQQIALLNSTFAGAMSFTLSSVDTSTNNAWFTARYGSSAYNQMIGALYVGDARTLNVYLYRPYVKKKGDTLGFSGYPWEYVDDPQGDGISIDYATLPGGASRSYGEGKTLVHETGHWLGLYHTFEPPSPYKSISRRNNGCLGKGDRISDTPAEKTAHYGCKAGRDTCPAKGQDPIHNFMDYSDDACLTEFTPNQLSRIRKVWASYRGVL